MHIAVIGAGAMGGWTAHHLLAQQAKVTLFDHWGPGHSRASSGGETRLIRGVYGGDEVYTSLVANAFREWKKFQDDIKQQVYFPTGSLWLFSKADDSYARKAIPLMAKEGLVFEEWSRVQVSERYPQVNIADVNSFFWEEEAGFLLARKASQLVVQDFQTKGGVFQSLAAQPSAFVDGEMPYLQLQHGERFYADAYVFACGPWLPQLFPALLGDTLSVSRQEIHYFGTPAAGRNFHRPHFPIWVDMGEKVYYGVPDYDGRGFKLADDTREGPMDPTHGDRSPTPEKIAAVKQYLAHRFPLMADAPMIEARTCQYTNSPNGHFLLDQHPEANNVWLAGAGCGHAFKMGPAVGQLMADRILHQKPIPALFSLSNLKSATVTSNQFEH